MSDSRSDPASALVLGPDADPAWDLGETAPDLLTQVEARIGADEEAQPIRDLQDRLAQVEVQVGVVLGVQDRLSRVEVQIGAMREIESRTEALEAVVESAPALEIALRRAAFFGAVYIAVAAVVPLMMLLLTRAEAVDPIVFFGWFLLFVCVLLPLLMWLGPKLAVRLFGPRES